MKNTDKQNKQTIDFEHFITVTNENTLYEEQQKALEDDLNYYEDKKKVIKQGVEDFIALKLYKDDHNVITQYAFIHNLKRFLDSLEDDLEKICLQLFREYYE